MHFAHTSEPEEITTLNLGRNLIVGEKYRVLLRSGGGVEGGWQLISVAQDGKLLLAKTASTIPNCFFLRQ